MPSPCFSGKKACRVCIKDVKSSIRSCKPERTGISITEISGGEGVNLTNQAEFQGTSYSVGMTLVYGSSAGLPDFAVILQIIIVHDTLVFVVKLQRAWYSEHFLCFKLESTRVVKVIKQSQLTGHVCRACINQGVKIYY